MRVVGCCRLDAGSDGYGHGYGYGGALTAEATDFGPPMRNLFFHMQYMLCTEPMRDFTWYCFSHVAVV